MCPCVYQLLLFRALCSLCADWMRVKNKQARPVHPSIIRISFIFGPSGYEYGHFLLCLFCAFLSVLSGCLCTRIFLKSLYEECFCVLDSACLLPYTTVYITHPWGGFPSTIARQPRGCQDRTIRLRKSLRATLPTQALSAPTLITLWRYRPWKNRPSAA